MFTRRCTNTSHYIVILRLYHLTVDDTIICCFFYMNVCEHQYSLAKKKTKQILFFPPEISIRIYLKNTDAVSI